MVLQSEEVLRTVRELLADESEEVILASAVAERLGIDPMDEERYNLLFTVLTSLNAHGQIRFEQVGGGDGVVFIAH